MSACFGLTQGDLESEHNTLFLSFLFFLFFSFSPIDLRQTGVCVVIGTTRYLCRRSLFLCDTSNWSIAVAHRRYCREVPYYSVSSANSLRTRGGIFRKYLYILSKYFKVVSREFD